MKQTSLILSGMAIALAAFALTAAASKAVRCARCGDFALKSHRCCK